MSYKLTQTGQEVQALLNQIKNGGQSQVTDAVLYSEQALNEKEQAQARKNIGAAAENQIPTGAVLYSQQQNLTGDQQAQARTNIGAVGTEQLPKKVSELENDAGYTTSAEVEQLIPDSLPVTYEKLSIVLDKSQWKGNDYALGTGTLPRSAHWTSVIYGGGKFVALASNQAKAAYSVDGIKWYDAQISSYGMGWNSVAYGDGKFVAIASDTQTAAYSLDGVNWASTTLPTRKYWRSVAYGDGKFVAIANDTSVAAYSTDGIGWTTMTLPSSTYWTSVIYGGGKFVAVSSRSVTAYSNDGVNWSASSFPAELESGAVSIAYGNGKFVAIPNDRSIAAYSTDGINWQTITLSNEQLSWYSITYGEGQFMATGTTGTRRLIAHSEDGVHWSTVVSDESQALGECITYGDNQFVTVFDGGGDKVWRLYSKECVQVVTNPLILVNSAVKLFTNTQYNLNPREKTEGALSVVSSDLPTDDISATLEIYNTNNEGAFEIVNTYAPTSLPQTSSNIIQGELPITGWVKDTWQNATFPLSGYYWTDMAYGDGKFVAVAERSGGTASTISAKQGVYSTDGVTWKTMSLPSAQHWGKICYGAGVFVTLSNGNIIPGVGDTTDSFAGAWSTNGRSWTQFTAPLRTGFGPLIFGKDKFLAIATNSTTTSRPYMYSTDGKSWVSQTDFPIECADITYGAGKFVAVDDGGTIAYSNDGLSWTKATISNMPGHDLDRCRICYGQGKFVILTETHYSGMACGYSMDGLNWSWTILPKSIQDTFNRVTNIAYGNGVFIAVDDSQYYGSSQCLYSYDGVSWFLCDFTGSGSWVKVVYGNDRFVALDTVGYSDSTGVNYWVATPSLNKYTYSISDSELDAHSDVVMTLEDENTISPATIQDQHMVVMRDTTPLTPIPYEYKRTQTSGKGQFTIVNSFVPTIPEIPTRVGQLENDAHYVTQNQVPVALPQKTGAIHSGVLPTIGWSPFDGDWQETTMPWEQPWNDVAYGNGKFVAIAEQTSRGAYSEDGITWEQMNMPVSAYWHSIAYGNGKFVAVSYNNSTVSAYSLDGVNWTQTTMPASAEWCSVVYGADKFVAIANQSDRAAYSLDGITWVETTMPSNSPWLDIAYGNNKFIVVSYEGGNLAYSNDGITWEQTTMFPSAGWRSVAYGNGVFVAVERDSNNAAYSSDGINWTMTKLPASGFWGHVVYGNGLFVATIGDGSAAAYSRDGINWTSLGKTTRDYWDVAYGDGKFVAVFYGQEGAYLKIAPGVVYTIRDNSITETSDVLMEVSDSGQIQAHGISKYNITIIRDTEPTASIPYTYKVKETNNQGQFTIVNNYFPDIPTKVSQLENDANYITESQVPTKISQFANDMDYATVGQIPTKVSQLNNDQNFTDNIGTITQIKINGKVKNPQPSGLIDLGNITPEPTDWTTVPITTALENGKTYVVKLDTTPYPLTAIFTMSEALDAIDANVVGGTQQGTDGASTYELQSATITVKDGKLTGLKSTNLVSNANPGAANLAYSESTFADLGITQYHYIELLNSVGGGMSGKGVNYTAIKDTLAIDKWTTDEIHVEGEILPTAEIVLVTFDDTVQHTIDKTKENTLLIGHATADELKNIGYWAFDGQSLVVNIISSTDPDTNAPLQVLFSETTDTYFKYLYQERNTTLATLYVYKSNYDTYTAGDIVLVLSADTASGIDWLKCSTLMPNAELNGFPAVKLYGYEFPSDLTGTSITIDVLCTKTDSPDIRKTLLLPYVGSEEVAPGAMLHMYSYEPATEEEAQAFPMSFMAYVFNSNAPELAPAGTIIVFGGDQSSGSDPKYVFSKLFSLTTTGMAPVTYTYLNENIKLESAIKVYLNDSENIQIIDRQEGYVQFKRAKVADIPFSMEILDTEEEGLLRLFNSYKEPIPTKLSQFQNDTKYLTKRNIDYRYPIQVSTSTYDADDIEIRIRDDYDVALAQYSGYPQTGQLEVNSWVEVSDGYTYTINDSNVFNNQTDVIMTVNSPIMLEAVELTRGTFKIKAKSKPTEPIPYTYKSLATRTKGQFTIVNGYIPTMPVVPTKTSELTNDSGYITQLVTETLQGTKRYKTFDDLTDCVLELGQYDAEGKYVYCV